MVTAEFASVVAQQSGVDRGAKRGERDLAESPRQACCPRSWAFVAVPIQVAAASRVKGAEFEALALGTLSSAAWGLGTTSACQTQAGQGPAGV